MDHPVPLFVLIISLYYASVFGAFREFSEFSRVSSNDNKIPTLDILGEYEAIQSLSECSSRCFKRPGCTTFFFNRGSGKCFATSSANGLEMFDGFMQFSIQTSILQWRIFGKSYYLLVKSKLAILEAQRHCLTLGAKLVEVDTPEENTFLTNMAIQENVDIHLGITDAFVEGQWVFLSSLDPVPLVNWSSRNPDNYRNQDCAGIAGYEGYKWDDYDCSSKMNFVCERLIG
ncbi:lectin BRA-3-like [Saccostrea echinata]|uniref:lectin BRA-3-like n=1 Tax=Saccostrea echinata TaxID=191078 RepID=UPI002A7F83F9|nr:lectin BRA-3-like [Saccostrea echinata]